MENNSSSNDQKRIFILGAGSSIGNSNGSFPSVDQFFTTARRLDLYNSEEYGNLHKYGKSTLGLNIFSLRAKTNIEDFFTFIEIEIERNPSHELFRIRQQLLSIIQQVLTGLGNEILNQSGEYKDFVSQLQLNDTIITFNWDISLDNHLQRELILESFIPDTKLDRDKIPYRHYLNFIHDYSALGEQTWKKIAVEQPYREWNIKKGYYLKAHGSVDWYYCLNESCRANRKVFPVLEQTEKFSCSECHEPLDCLIIPPILNKGYRQYPLIRRIWNLATKEISSGTQLVIWGYSLPSTDFYCSWLIRQARQAPIKSLILINPDVISKRKNKIVLGKAYVNKFTSIFIGLDVKTFLYENFNDYISHKEIKDKYGIEGY